MSLFRRTLSPGVGHGVALAGGRVRVPLPLWLAVWALRRAGRGLWWLARHPAVLALLAAMVGVWWVIDRLAVWSLPVLGVPLVGCCLWSLTSPGSFDRWVETPVRSRWRRFWTYRRWWQPAMVTAGLARVHGTAEHLPTLARVWSTAVVDVVRVRMLPGQTVEDWAKAGPRLAQTFGAPSCRARTVDGREHLVDLWLQRGDPLADDVPVPPPAADVDLTAVPVGVREDGDVLTLPLLYSHLLVGGETGSGKGSVIWSLLCGVAPAVRGGLVRVWAIDPKGGAELGPGAALFDQFRHGGPEEAAELLELAVRGMRARAQRLRQAGSRKVVPGTDNPLIIIVIDELASLVAYVSDARLRRRIVDALALLLSQGRAVGVCVVAATQDVRKETIGLRDLFPTRVALRAAEPEQADMLLGRGARERGALTDRIPHDLPGGGYVVEDGAPEPVRARFAHVTDDVIGRVAGEFGRPVAREPQRG